MGNFGPRTRASISAVPSIQGLRIMSGRTLPKDLHGFLDPNDGVAISFWIISIAMVAATVFFLMESTAVAGHWSTSMNVGALVTLVAAVHYFYMREFWVQLHTSPILYRYIDWTITVPLQMTEFYLILSAVSKDISQASFWKLLIGTIVMLVAGYAGEANMLDPWIGFGSKPICGEIFRHHANYRHCRLVHLPRGLFLWLLAWRC